MAQAPRKSALADTQVCAEGLAQQQPTSNGGTKYAETESRVDAGRELACNLKGE
jgi:hypothetical protein